MINDANKEQLSALAISPVSDCSNSLPGQDRRAVILAGGDGTRLLSLTRAISGDERPKQFCSVLGRRGTLLAETRRRVALGFSPAQTMFVLTEKHERYFSRALADAPPRNLIVQPKNIGTAPAILYSLLRLEQINPSAAAAFFPSDHYFFDDRKFISYVEIAFDAVSRQPDSIILLGIEPESPDEEYGWIEPDECAETRTAGYLRKVRRFWEKPAPALARSLFRGGCLWNSFVMVGTVAAFLKMIETAAPDLYRNFAAVKSKLSADDEKNVIGALYENLPDSNFSKDVLAKSAEMLSVLPVSNLKWSDLGNPRRVLSTLAEIGEPNLKLPSLPEINQRMTRENI